MEKVTIALIDDHPPIIEGLNFFLEDNPRFNVIGSAESGEKALELITNLKPNIAILDLEMKGGKSGFDVVRALKNKGNYQTKIIVYTGFGDNPNYLRLILLYKDIIKGLIIKDQKWIELKNCLEIVIRGGTYISPPHQSSEVTEEFEKLLSLTPKEKFILKEIARGKSNDDIIKDHNKSRTLNKMVLRTLEAHRLKIREKLGLTIKRDRPRIEIQPRTKKKQKYLDAYAIEYRELILHLPD